MEREEQIFRQDIVEEAKSSWKSRMGRKSKNSKNRGADTGRAEEEDEDEEFTVDKILDKKTEDGQVKYLIHWEGYDERWALWLQVRFLKTFPPKSSFL